MDIKSQITSSIAKNEELLSTLASTDYAGPALQQQNAYIKDLEGQESKTTRDLNGYKQRTKVEQKEFEKYRDSTMKRFAYRMGGSKGKEKFASKHEKEEKEYYEALHAERSCEDSLNTIQSALKEARDVKAKYDADSNRHKSAQKELDNLYHMIFSGPTPAFPEEDQKEHPFTLAKEAFDHVERNYQAIHQAHGCLDTASKRMHNAQMHVADALDASRMDMWGVGGSMADMAERDALSRAESESAQILGLVEQARRMYPPIEPIGPIGIAKGSMMSDILFDNIFSDMDFHDKIKNSSAQLQSAGANLARRLEQVRAAEREEKVNLQRESERLKTARKELQQARQAIFERVSAENGQGGAPPAYSA